MKLSLCPSPSAKEKRLVYKIHFIRASHGELPFERAEIVFGFQNPFKITAEAEPERSEGEATTLKNAEIVNWRYLLDKIRTFFDENPDCDF